MTAGGLSLTDIAQTDREYDDIMAQNTKPTISSLFIPVSVTRSLEKARAKIKNAGLIAQESEFLLTVLDMSSERLESLSALDDVVVLEMPDISEGMKTREQVGNTQRAITSKCKRLTSAGFFRMTDGVRDPKRGGRLPLYFILQPIHEADFEHEDARELRERAQGHRNHRVKTTQATLKFLRESDAQLISHMRDIKPVTETIFTGLLDRAMRFSTKEKPDNNRISSKFKVKGVEILVLATTATGPSSELAALSDQRVIRALLSEIVDWIDKTINEYILYVEQPRQPSLFGDDEEPADALAGISCTASERIDHDIPDEDDSVDLQTRAEQQREALEQAATDRIRNSFVIDVVNIAKRMGYKNPHSTSARRFINQSLRRLYDTNFRMVIRGKHDGEVAKVMRMFGLSDVASDFRFLTDLKSQYDDAFLDESDEDIQTDTAAGTIPAQIDVNSKEVQRIENDVDPYAQGELERVRFWRLSLDTMLFDKLLNPEERKLFTAHEEIMKEQSGLGQTLYNLFTSTLGRRNRGAEERVFVTTLHQLHNTLWATRRYARFQEDFCELMKRYMPKGSWDESLTSNKARMFGYVFVLKHADVEKNGRPIKVLELTVTRDRDDPLSGDNSYFNKQISGRLKTFDRSEDETKDAQESFAASNVEAQKQELMERPWFQALPGPKQRTILSRYPALRLDDQKVVKLHGLSSPYVRELMGFEV